MVEEVNRLVGNLLAGGGEVSLPGVGRSARSGVRRSDSPGVRSCRPAAW